MSDEEEKGGGKGDVMGRGDYVPNRVVGSKGETMERDEE